MPYRIFSLAIIIAVFVNLPARAADIDFPDANLDTVIREILKKKQIDKSDKTKKITDEDVATIFFLEAPNRGIESLSGLEKCRNLALIKLTGNKIKDVKPLEECVNVQSLDLAKNQIVDFSPLGKLTKLQYIQLDDNQIQKLDGVESLKALGALYLSRNQIESLQPLAELTKLHALYLDKNKVGDISPLKGLRWLERLDLKDNRVKDLSALAEMTELRFTFLERNQLTDLSTLVEMAKKDIAGERRFAPYWNLYLAGNPLGESGKAQLQELAKLGVRVVGEEKITLWPNGAPGAVGTNETDRPSLTAYLPPADRASGTAIVICPGGGYGHLAVGHEGEEIGRWLNSMGVAGFVLRYRLAPTYQHPSPMLDVQRGLRIVRARASEWKIDPAKIGVLGFSAGGHLASTATTHFDDGDPLAADPVDKVSCRPDFAVLCYPVISFTDESVMHRGSRDNLIGKSPPAELIELLSNEKRVTAKTPPAFLWHTTEDTAVPPGNSALFYLGCVKAGVPAELHIYEKGPHGIGLAKNVPGADQWPIQCEAWLRGRGFVAQTTANHGR